METHLADWLKGTPDGETAESILRKCVHCGFCTATCPTYQLLGDELDGPRGRIYLIKQMVEGATPTVSTQLHLDRCLTCRNCESTCPSGVDYGHLVDIGRKLADARVQRPFAQRALRTVLRESLTRRWMFEPAMSLGKRLRPVLPAALRRKVPAPRPPGAWPRAARERRMLMLRGCVQPAMAPSIDAATARVLDRLGIQVIVDDRSGCCGAIRHHLDDHEGALADARRNIDAWWPHLEAGVEALVINASGCGAMIKDYAHLLRNDPAYASKAARVVAQTRDLAELLPPLLEQIRPLARGIDAVPTVFHPPCTLQHGQKVRGQVEALLIGLGVRLVAADEAHLCCGSAGTYSITQPELSMRLRDRKLRGLGANGAKRILSANIGCLTHLETGTALPVRHWIEWLDEVTT
ncbi:MAG: glycolate oxidase subunit GlcF [Burkholderiaceae bacterium]